MVCDGNVTRISTANNHIDYFKWSNGRCYENG